MSGTGTTRALAGFPIRQRLKIPEPHMDTLLLIIIVLLLIGGGGWGYSRWRG